MEELQQFNLKIFLSKEEVKALKAHLKGNVFYEANPKDPFELKLNRYAHALIKNDIKAQHMGE